MAKQIQIRIQLFGPFQVWRDETLIPSNVWKRRKTQALLKILLTEPGQVFGQDQLVELLFADLDPDKALQNLHARISELRRVLEPNLPRGTASTYVLSVGKGRYRFNADAPCWIDAIEFQRQLKEGLQHYADQAWDEARHRLEKAVELHHGDYLAEDRYESWAQEFSRQMGENFAGALIALAACYAQSSQTRLAIQTLETVANHAPLREDVCCQLMQLHHDAGNPGAVVRVYEQCQHHLDEMLNVSPSEATQKLFQALTQPSTWQTRTVMHSIAVLPFVQLSSREEHNYFSDGLTEDVIAQLSKIRELKVISRTSVMRYKQTVKSIKTIGQELGASAILEGSVQSLGSRVRIHAQLIDAKDDSHLWTETYNREFHDIFEIQGDVAQQIALALKTQLSHQEQARLVKPQTRNMSAYQDYLKGRFFWNKRTKEGQLKAIDFFEAALKQDPDYALAYAGLADSYTMLGWFGYLPGEQMFPKGLQAAQRALELDPQLAEAHTSLAYLTLNHLWDWDRAQQMFHTALNLNPNYATAHQWYAEYLSILCRHDEAVNSMRTALELDPLSLVMNTVLAWKLCFADSLDEAEAQCHRALELDLDFGPAHTVLGLIHERRGNYDLAIREFEIEIEKSGEHIPNLTSLAFAHARAGHQDQAHCLLKKIKQWDQVTDFHIAIVHVGLGELDKALDHLEKAIDAHSWVVVYLKAVSRFEPLHNDARFSKLLNRIGL
jgi:TolB-like protein/two-component SAPR family response regulator/Tfp pilus assembly protein PilF